MDVTLIAGSVIGGVVVALVGGLALDCIRGVGRRAEGRLARALEGIPGEEDRMRWREELDRVLLECDGRPLKQLRESSELIRAAERLVAVYEDLPARSWASAESDRPELEAPLEPSLSGLFARVDGVILDKAFELLSYRERRILELRHGLSGQEPKSLDGIAGIFGISIDRVQEIEQISLMKLASVAEAQKLRQV